MNLSRFLFPLVLLEMLVQAFVVVSPRIHRAVEGSRIVLAATSRPPRSEGTFSFVEGSDVYQSLEEEIEAMGGDPSFLDLDESVRTRGAPGDGDLATASGVEGIVGTGPAKEFIWDGEVDEDAYFDD